MDFAALPPEINSARMYSGPGSAPMLAAAAAWDMLATELHSAAAGCSEQIANLTAEAWRGQAANSMAAVAAEHIRWLATSATHAQSAAEQARVAVEAYEVAFCSTVPPVMIMANRSQLMSLVATNILGQNAAAIAATEAHYAEMWAQDAAAMYEYADASSGATRLVPFRAPTPIANPNQTAGQAASNVSQLTTLIRAIPPALQNLTSSLQSTSAAGAPTGIAGLLTDLGLTTPVAFLNPVNSALTVTSLGGSYWAWGTAAQTDVGLLSAQQQIGDTENQILERLGKTTAPPPTESTVSATAGRAATLGGLSVPQGWVAQAPAIRLAALTSPPSMVSAALGGVSGSTPSFFSATDLAAAAMLRRTPGAAASQMPASQPMTSPPRTRATMLPAGLGGPLSGIAAELYHLAGLRELGILTTEEFDRQKSRLLGDT